jgi:hypothetical protein
MFRALSLKALTMVTLCTGAALASGCAGSSDTSDTESASEAQSQALLSSELGAPLGAMSAEGLAIDMGLSLVKAIGGKLATDYLFPTSMLDAKQLVASIDAAVEAQLLDLVLNSGKQGIGGAARDLADQEAFVRGGGSPERSYPATWTVLTTLNYVLSGVDFSAPVKQQRAGTKIYATAAQLKLNTRMFRIQLDPANAAAERTVLRADLQRAIDELGRLVDAARNDDMNARLGKIGSCTTWTRLEPRWCNSGPQAIYCPIRHTVMGFADGAGPGFSREENDLGACQVEWGIYTREEEDKFANGTLNPRYAFEAKMIDGWAAALAALDGKAAPQSGRALSLDFHGAYGYGTGGRFYVNPLTNYISCPAGSQESALLGRGHIDWRAAQCTSKPTDFTSEPAIDFGGLVGWIPTPLQNRYACPVGFPHDAVTQIHGADGLDDPLYYCSRPHVPGTPQPILYGGAYSRGGVDGTNSWVNPATGLAICPNGFTSSHVQGKYFWDGRVKDHPVVMCWKMFEPS